MIFKRIAFAVATTFAATFALVAQANDNPLPIADAASIPYLTVDTQVTKHSVERRGFVSVPLDYANPDGKTIDIFYRLMPASGSTIDDRSKPILMVMNGGPGSSSSGYRPLDYDYQQQTEQRDARDRYISLAKYFRILAVDQRGTGNSVPLDLSSPALNADIIARYFDADEQALDHGAVVKAVVPKGEAFFILARSYGGMIGFEYLIRPELPHPAGVVLSSAIQPHTNGTRVFVNRRAKQLALQQQMLETHPQIKKKLIKLRQKLTMGGLDHQQLNQLWNDLGKGVGWQQQLSNKLDGLLTNTPAEAFKRLSAEEIGTVNLLNYVLSSKALTTGYTDRTITDLTYAQVPFESWMLDENWTLNQIGNDGSWKQKFIEGVDANPPAANDMGDVKAIKQAMKDHQVLFTFGRSDSFLEYKTQLDYGKRFDTPEHTQYKVFDGGHGAAFSAQGAKEVWLWARDILRMF
jgi:pimeloyl-ACP methyl ester carboxylesterase